MRTFLYILSFCALATSIIFLLVGSMHRKGPPSLLLVYRDPILRREWKESRQGRIFSLIRNIIMGGAIISLVAFGNANGRSDYYLSIMTAIVQALIFGGIVRIRPGLILILGSGSVWFASFCLLLVNYRVPTDRASLFLSTVYFSALLGGILYISAWLNYIEKDKSKIS
jgi:hypothetical protein